MIKKEYDLESAIQYFINNPSLTGTDVAKLFNIPRSTLAENLRKRSISGTYFRKLKYFLNDDYFKVVDTPDKAYWIGWIQADGDISSKGKIRLRINEEDSYILEQFSHDLESNIPVNIRFLESGYGHSQRTAELKIDRMNMCKDLANIGLYPHKSLTTNYIDFYKIELVNSYLRGLFDGDGWINIHNSSREVGFSGTRSVCEGIQKFLFETYDISSHLDSYKNIYRLRIQKKEHILKFYKEIYKNADNHYLKRKQIKFEAFARSYDSLNHKSMSLKDRKYWKAKLGSYKENLQALLIRGEGEV